VVSSECGCIICFENSGSYNVICEVAMSAMHYTGGVLFVSVIQLAVVVRSGAAETASPT